MALPTVLQAKAQQFGLDYDLAYTYAFTSNVTAGSTLVVAATTYQFVLTSCTDSQGNLYTLHGSATEAAIPGGTWLWSTIAATSGPCTVTVQTSAISWVSIGLLEVSAGCPVTSVSTGAHSSAGPAQPDAAITTALDGLVVGMMGKRTGGTITPPVGWTEVAQSTSTANMPFSFAYAIGGAGTYTAAWTLGSGGAWSVVATGLEVTPTPPAGGIRNLLTGYQHTVSGGGADNLLAGRSNTVTGDMSEAHGEDATVTGTRSTLWNIDGTPRTLALDDTFEIGGDFIVTGTATIPGLPYAPIDASYVTISADTELTAERVLTAGTGISITDGGPGSTVTIAATGSASGHYDAPLSDGDLTAASIIFASGECVIVQVPV